jgi:hypothetical protein
MKQTGAFVSFEAEAWKNAGEPDVLFQGRVVGSTLRRLAKTQEVGCIPVSSSLSWIPAFRYGQVVIVEETPFSP